MKSIRNLFKIPRRFRKPLRRLRRWFLFLGPIIGLLNLIVRLAQLWLQYQG